MLLPPLLSLSVAVAVAAVITAPLLQQRPLLLPSYIAAAIAFAATVTFAVTRLHQFIN